jgi:hypothetical protein
MTISDRLYFRPPRPFVYYAHFAQPPFVRFERLVVEL